MPAIQRSLVALTLSFILLQSHADTPVEVIALYKDRAVVRHQGDQAMLKVGETSKFGVTLLSADPHTAKVRFEERLYELKINNKVSTRFKTPSVRTVRRNEDSLGQYRSHGRINQQYVSFLVDTGASAVALSQRQADQLCIDYSQSRTGVV